MSHTDALGYLTDLKKEVGSPWFEMLCNLAVADTKAINDADFEVLFAILIGKASYLPTAFP
jgi:hypothetical protein